MAGPKHRDFSSDDSSWEVFQGRRYFVENIHFRPKYYDGEDWGVAFLHVVDVTEPLEDVVPYHMLKTIIARKQIVVELRISPKRYTAGKNLICPYEQGDVTLCYNDESGNVYRTTLAENNPRAACLFYDSKNKNRKELIELWQQLNKEKDKHEKIFDAAEWEKKEK